MQPNNPDTMICLPEASPLTGPGQFLAHFSTPESWRKSTRVLLENDHVTEGLGF